MGHTSVGGDGTDSSVMDVMQYERPQAVRPWRDGAGVRVGSKNNSFNNLDISAISPKTVPHTPAGAIDPPTTAVWQGPSRYTPCVVGRDYWLDGFGRVTTVGPAPALRYTGSSNVQLPLALHAPPSIYSGHSAVLHDMTHYYPHLNTNEAAGLQAPFSSPHISAGLQVPGGSNNLNSSQPPVDSRSQESSPLFFGTTAMTLASFRNTLPHASPMLSLWQQPLLPRSTLGQKVSALPPRPRSSTTRGGVHGRGSKGFENYPPRSEPLPLGLSRPQICWGYPNHLHGDILLRVVYGCGQEQGLGLGRIFGTLALRTVDITPLTAVHTTTWSRELGGLRQKLHVGAWGCDIQKGPKGDVMIQL